MSGSDSTLYIKGYKLDREKLKQKFGEREDDPENARFIPLVNHFPGQYKYITTGFEPANLVVVLEDGYDKAELEKKPILELVEPYTVQRL